MQFVEERGRMLQSILQVKSVISYKDRLVVPSLQRGEALKNKEDLSLRHVEMNYSHKMAPVMSLF